MKKLDVFVRAVGAVTAAGTGLDALRQALQDPNWNETACLERPDGQPLPVFLVRDFNPKNVLPPLVARRLDRPARLLAVAARECLEAVGENRTWTRETIGVTAGTWNAGTSALLEVLHTVFLVAPDEAPPAQFPSTVANAPASQLGILDQLAGPNITFAEKQAGGMRAIVEAARWLSHGRGSAFFACGVDEANWLNAEGYDRLGSLIRGRRPGMAMAEGAAVVLLTPEAGDAPLARITGWASASTADAPYLYSQHPDTLAGVMINAIDRGGLKPNNIDLVISLANGLPKLAELERRACELVFGAHRPASLAIADRLGEGAFCSALRVVIAVECLAERVLPRWEPPSHLQEAGYPTLNRRPLNALVTALAGGGSTHAMLLTAV